MNDHFKRVEAQTHQIYTEHGPAFDQQRPKKLHERGWLERFTAELAEGGSILDVGCGAADPIAAFFIRQGYQVTGIDFSVSMIDLARNRYPKNNWIVADMRQLDLDEQFDGIIAWNSFFHLKKSDQRNTLPLFCSHLAPDGVLMITVGPEDGEVIGHVNGQEVYHSSLSPEEYTSILNRLGLDVLAFVLEDETCDMQTVLLAKKRHDV